MKDEEIAREIVDAIHIDVGGWDYWGERPYHGNPNETRTLIAAALATARRAGFDAAKEQAAEVADKFTGAQHAAHDMRTGVFPKQSYMGEAIAAAIRAMEPKP